ncbi:hypothetical protein Tco_1293512 [Tanacetum coccineum]
MACLVPHSDDEIQALVQKLIDEDMVHQKAILDLALQFDNACTAKDDLRKAYKKCNHIPQESRALIDTFLKEGSDKDYELNLSMYGKAAKIEKLMNANRNISVCEEIIDSIRVWNNVEELGIAVRRWIKEGNVMEPDCKEGLQFNLRDARIISYLFSEIDRNLCFVPTCQNECGDEVLFLRRS